MAEPVTEPEFVSFAGMQIPRPTYDLLMAAVRRKYPTLTQDLEDDPAAQAVLVSFMASILESDIADQANQQLTAATAQLRAAHEASVEQGRAQVRLAIEAIQKPPPEL